MSELERMTQRMEALEAALESIAGIGFDAPATWAGTDKEWERNRANKMQLMARTALKGEHHDQ